MFEEDLRGSTVDALRPRSSVVESIKLISLKIELATTVWLPEIMSSWRLPVKFTDQLKSQATYADQSDANPGSYRANQ